jgi:hypothetical protein
MMFGQGKFHDLFEYLNWIKDFGLFLLMLPTHFIRPCQSFTMHIQNTRGIQNIDHEGHKEDDV